MTAANDMPPVEDMTPAERALFEEQKARVIQMMVEIDAEGVENVRDPRKISLIVALTQMGLMDNTASYEASRAKADDRLKSLN